MEIYRISVESHLSHCEANRSFTKTGSSMQEEVDITMYDAAAEFGYHENAYDEEEGETSTYYLHGDFEGSRSMKHDQKKRKNLMKSNSATSYDLGADMPYGLSTIGSHQNTLMGKRPANNLHLGSFPTKRTRTASASRPRVISPFSGAGSAGGLQAPMKTDASSGDTSSFQDDQSTLYGGLQIQKSMEVESVGDFERQLPYDSAETSTKPKKKKKVKHQGSAYEQGWQLDSTVHTEQRDNSKKRVEGQHFDSNGTSGLYRQHSTKKLKIMKQTLDSTYDNMAPMSGSIPSPATSQMSNMSNTNRFMKIINGCNRSKKSKSSKMSAGQPGSGSPWSLFEDQALVVLVHDMGPNWQLVSDAINSTLQFKCIFRKPLECKERHKILMDKGAADGADSGDDSGSSQSYPSTLPGIPKGSARQLFQHLQGPMLEDTLKSHFEKIIVIGKKLHYRRNQNDNQDPRQTAAVHNSHVIALSQVFPNNLNGCVLTPLDLCDATAASPDVHSLGHPGCHASGSPLPNQGDVNSSLRGASGMILGNNSVSASSSAPLNAPVRDGRYNCPRASLPVDEQQRMQHFNQMYSNRNLQPNLPVSSALSGADRGVRMLPGGNGIGMMPGMNRSMPLPRPGYQGMASSSTPNSGSMLSSGIVGIPSPLGMNSGTGSGQGNLMIRPREALHMMRPGHNPEHQRQMMVPEIEMQVKQGNGQGIPAFNGLHTAFANQTTPPHVQAYPGHTQQHQMSAQQPHMLSNPNRSHLQAPNHVAGSQQQAYAIRLAKEKQMQQRLLQQQQQQQQKQQQLAASSALMPHVQPQPQLPMSSSMQNNTQIQQQTSSQPGSMPPFAPSSPLTPVSVQQQQQQKHNLPHHGLNRNPQAGAIGLTNQMGKQRPRQPQQQQQQFQQSGRHHPQQHQSQSSQQAKVLKGMGRGNMIVHRNIPMDPCHLNGLSVTSGNQGTEKEEQIGHSMKGQSLYSGTGLNSTQLSKPFVSQPSNHSHSQPQQKLFSDSTSPPSKSLQQMPSHSDNNTQNQVHLVPSSHALATTHQVVPSPVMASNHQHLQSQPQPHQKQVSQTQLAVQRMSQQNGQVNTDLPSKPQTDRCHTEQQPVKNVSQMSVSTTTTMPQACNDSANVVPIVSSAVALQRKPSESSCDSGMSNRSTQGGSIGSPSLMSPAVLGKQGLGGLRQLSGGLMQHGQSAVAQCKQPQPPQSTKPPSSSQQKLQQQEQLQEQEKLGQQQLPLQQSQQQAQHLQSAQGSLYIRPTNSKLE